MTDTVRPTFGPTALATPANALTAARLLAAPVFVGLVLSEGATWLTVSVGVLVAGSDGVDGWVARRQGATRSGAFLDPLADKFLVLGAFFALGAKGTLPWPPIVLMAGREVAMSAYRSWAGRRGISLPARRSAKLKTVVQDLAIATCLVPPIASQHHLQLGAVWVATALTLSSGAQYVRDGRVALGERRRRAAPGAPPTPPAPAVPSRSPAPSTSPAVPFASGAPSTPPASSGSRAPGDQDGNATAAPPP